MSESLQNISEKISSLTIGHVESVSPNEIKILLDLFAPQSTALNTGYPVGFPRINNFLLIPNETGAVVGLIVWVGIERSPFPKRLGLEKDFGLIDLPFPLRKLTLTPLGTLVREKRNHSSSPYKLERGVTVFPSVGDSALLPTEDQLHAIIQASKREDQRVCIGTSPLTGNAKVTIDPDKLFGRHLAVLGNTGSGKSCTVAGLIRWSLDSAEKNKEQNIEKVNARFILLDPNGEYSKAFQDHNARIFKVPQEIKNGTKEIPLRVPAWMWNSHEWSAFAHAQPGSQRPILLQGLRAIRSGTESNLPDNYIIRLVRQLKGYRTILTGYINQGPTAYTSFGPQQTCGQSIAIIERISQEYLTEGNVDESGTIQKLVDITGRVRSMTSYQTQGRTFYNAFSEKQLQDIISAIDNAIDKLPKISVENEVNEDAPKQFNVADLPELLEVVAANQGQNAVLFISWLTMRIRSMINDKRLGPIIDTQEPTFEKWLEDTIGSDDKNVGSVSIMDLSLVPSEVIHLVIAVIARIIFEATQRYVKIHQEKKQLPTVLVLEEAHTFIRRGTDTEEGYISPAQMCRQTFERIAREGRKFGLGLVLSSQRPSELSQTVLAQCNTFILHRIVNDRDQELVSKLVPDNMGGLLRELPSLPSRRAVLLGWASSIPTLVDILELPFRQRPRSADPDFWDVWTGKEERKIVWKEIYEDWIS